MTETAWIYCAVSSEHQAKNLANDQLEWAQRTAVEQGWAVTRVFGDDAESGVGSGAVSIRKILKTLLQELESTPKKQRPKRIILSRVDRLGREALDTVAAIAQIRRLGVMLHTRQDGDIRLETASDAILPMLRAITGALENEARSDKWKAVHARNRAAGKHIGNVPFGIMLDDLKRPTPCEPEASIVREMFDRAASGWGYGRLAKWMQQTAPVKRLQDGGTKPIKWAPSTVKYLLDSRTIQNVVVTKDLWLRAHAHRGSDFRARAPRRWPWPLLGALRCICGKMLVGHCAGNEPYRVRYYVCRWHPDESGIARRPSHRAPDLEAAFVGVLRRLRAEPWLVIEENNKPNMDSLQQSERRLNIALADVDRRRQSVWKLAEDGNLSSLQVRDRLDELEADRVRTKTDLERVQAMITESERLARYAESVSSFIDNLEDTWERADTEQRKAIAQAVASLPTIGGLFVDPSQRGVILVGTDLVARVQESDASRMLATSSLLLRLAQGFSLVSRPPS